MVEIAEESPAAVQDHVNLCQAPLGHDRRGPSSPDHGPTSQPHSPLPESVRSAKEATAPRAQAYRHAVVAQSTEGPVPRPARGGRPDGQLTGAHSMGPKAS